MQKRRRPTTKKLRDEGTYAKRRKINIPQNFALDTFAVICSFMRPKDIQSVLVTCKQIHDFIFKVLHFDERSSTAVLRSIIQFNRTLFLELLIAKNSSFDPSCDNNIAIRHFSLTGSLPIVKLLLTNSKVNPLERGITEKNLKPVQMLSRPEQYLNALQCAAYGGHSQILELILNERTRGWDTAKDGNVALFAACTAGNVEIVRLLFCYVGLVNVAENVLPSVFAAVSKGHAPVIQFLLEEMFELISPEFDSLLLAAASYFHVQVLKVLLGYSQIDPSINSNFVFKTAVYNRNAEIIEILLRDKRVDPTIHNNFAIQQACSTGDDAMVKVLLEHRDVDPEVCDNEPICSAARKGYYEVIRLLLIDSRADPATDNNYPVRIAVVKGFTEIVELLLNDYRVKHSVDHNTLLTIALQHQRTQMVHLLNPCAD